MQKFDVAIIGAGIVGLATGYQLLRRFPRLRLAMLEKEADLAQHQTGHNSGVLHSGIYYKPGSLKALNCRAGKSAMEAFCRDEGIPFDICGKVIVAVTHDEIPALSRIHERGQANNVQATMIDRAQLKELEPHAEGVRAIHVPEAGIIDFPQVCVRLAEHVRRGEGEIVTGARVTGMRTDESDVTIQTTAGDFSSRYVVNCAGLQCDRVTAMSGQAPAARIVPFRGEYFELKPEAEHLCRNLIYPTPNPAFPFLGVHFTRMIHGGVECGPNAVLAFAREGYRKTDINVRDLFESLTYPGFLRMAAKYWRTGLGEMWRSYNKQAFVKALQRLVPEIRAEYLVPAPAGVRAQALLRDGSMVDDFLIQDSGRVVNVENAPSPAATASLNVGNLVVDHLAKRMA
jgi:L-2-hydroxyglutarate oxidase